MKKSLILICTVLACAVSSFSFGQNAAIQLNNNNALYVGIPDNIQVSISNVKASKIIVKTSDNIELKKSDSSTSILALSRGRGTVYVGYKRKKDTIWIDSLSIRLKQLPKPIAKLGTIESGSHMARSAVAIHTSIRLSYGNTGLSSLPSAKVTSYRMIIIDAEGFSKFLFKGSHIPDSIRHRIYKARGGTILVDRLRGFNPTTKETFHLKPIYIFLDKSNFRYVNASIVTQTGALRTFNDVTKLYTIDSIYQSINSGTISTFYDNYRFDKKYHNGVITQKSYHDDMNRLVYVMEPIGPQTWSFQKFDISGSLRIQTTIHDTLKFKGSDEIVNSFNWRTRGYVMDSVALEFDMQTVDYDYHLTPLDSFTSFYTNGQIKTNGILIFSPSTHHRGAFSHGDRMLKSYNTSVMHGKWTFYNESGEILEERIYDMGILVKE
ncbi:MAG: hypothetical protein ACI9JN_000020 [Bacteroidia bacterium]|jgi:hypothetical protein